LGDGKSTGFNGKKIFIKLIIEVRERMKDTHHWRA